MTSSPGQEKCLWIVQILNQFQKVTENVQFMDMIDGGSKSWPAEVVLYIERVYIFRTPSAGPDFLDGSIRQVRPQNLAPRR